MIAGKDRGFSIIQPVHISSDAHPASYLMDIGVFFPGVK
jgi:hypothetical protein